jgi:lipopolysaccharide transport system ATP-binding protein
VRAIDEAHSTQNAFDIRRPIGIELTIEVREPLKFVPWLQLESDLGGPIFSAFDTDQSWRQPRAPGTYTSTAWIPGDLLNEGTVVVTASLNTFVSGGRADIAARALEAITFQVLDAGDGTTSRGDYVGTWTAPVRPLLSWDLSSR